MPERYDLYGFESLSLEEAAPIVEAAIAQPLEERDSSYYAGAYLGYRLGSGRGVRMYKNHDPRTGAFVRSEFPEFALLIEIDDLPDMEGIATRLASSQPAPRLLRSTIQEIDADQ